MIATIDLVPAELRPYAGRRFRMDNPAARAEHMAFTFANMCLARPTSPFWQVSINGLLLCPATEDYLYNSDYGKISRPYRKGHAPLLEWYIDQYTRPGMSDTEKVIALSQSMFYDLKRRFPPPPAFLYNESDEQTILKGGGHCSCKARLLCALCQVMGIPARPLMHWTWRGRAIDPARMFGGHTTAEVFLDGQWGFFDPQHHMYAAPVDGRIPGVRDIRRHPEIFTRVDPAVTAAMQPVPYTDTGVPMDFWQDYWERNFDPRCPNQISRYDVNEPYTPGWLWATEDLRRRQNHDMKRNRDVLNELVAAGQLSDEVYQMDLGQFRQFAGITDGQLEML